MGAIGYTPTKAVQDAQEASEGKNTIRRIEIPLGGDKDIRSLASELDAGTCFAEECVDGLCNLEGRDVLGTLNVLQVYLKYLNSVASELCYLLHKAGESA
jgi:hypothetical protein